MNIRKQERKERAAERAAANINLTIEQKIAKARSRRGNSAKEIARLEAQLSKQAAA
jgi:hypothetical protein